MTVADLIEIRKDRFGSKDQMLQCSLIALDAKDGKRLFDTRINKKEFIDQFMQGEVVALWADVVLQKGIAYGDSFRPVMKCYVSHGSWERKEK